ncbi:porin [Duganella rivi]|nr:porin [Duganella rivi]
MALCWSCALPAFSQVTLYGVIDTGIERVNHTNAAGDAVTRMPTLTGTLPSRWGVRGTEDLGNGASAVFQLESQFGPDTGAQGQGGRLFGRQAWLGLRGSFGTLSIGRQSNMTFHALVKTDTVGPSIHGVTNMDLYLPNARSDNALAYNGVFNNFIVGASHSFGRDANPAGFSGPSATNCPGESAADKRACRQTTALLGYDTGTWAVFTSWDKQHGGAGASNGLTRSADQERRRVISGYYLRGAVKLGGGYIKRDTVAGSRQESGLYFLGASIADRLWTYDVQCAHLDVEASPNDTTLYVARVIYHLSKRTALYGTWGYVRNRGSAAIAVDAGGTVGRGLNQSGQMLGVRHVF